MRINLGAVENNDKIGYPPFGITLYLITVIFLLLSIKNSEIIF